MMSKPIKSESSQTSGNDEDDDHQKVLKKAGSSQMQQLLLGKNSSSSKAGGAVVRCCQADKCSADLAMAAKPYHKRHKVCEVHAKAQVVLVNGIGQRFCQQCSRFHEVSEFDESKRSCRMRLAGHNKRRRKSPAGQAATDPQQAQDINSNHKAGMICGRVNDSGQFKYSVPEKHFHIK